MDEINKKLLDHFMNPRNVGIIENPDGYGQAENPVNGYRTDYYIRVKNDEIVDIKFKTFGCVVTVASASALTVVLTGKSLKEIVDSKHPLTSMLELLQREIGDVPEKNWHCPPSVILSFFTALEDYYQKNSDSERVKKIDMILLEIRQYFEKN
jgi:nitrogen fixation NifU-like protein